MSLRAEKVMGLFVLGFLALQPALGFLRGKPFVLGAVGENAGGYRVQCG